MSTQEQVAEALRNAVDWDRFFSVVQAIGDSLNGPKDRFDKSDIFELALEVFSGGTVRYLNEEGRDHSIPSLDAFIEMKYDEKCLFSPITKRPQTTVSLTLVNTMGNRNSIELPEHYAGYVLAVGANGCAVVSKTIVGRYLFRTNDQLKSRVPFNEFSIIKRPNEISRFEVIPGVPYKEQKLRIQREFLESCRKR